MPRPLLIFSQSDYLIQFIDIDSHTKWQTLQIQITWLLQKPNYLDLYWFQRQGISGSARQELRVVLFWCYMAIITKTRLYNVDPLKPHFYIVKLGFTGVYIIFHISAQNIDCGYSLELPRWGGSNEYSQFMFLRRHKKNIRIFIWNFSYFAGKFSNIFE